MGIRARRKVHDALGHECVSNPGLRWSHFLPIQKDATSGERDNEVRAHFLESFEQYKAEGLTPYRGYFERWKRALRDRESGASAGADGDTRLLVLTATWSARSRVAFGLGDEHVLELGLRLTRTYGLPVLPGSALKGVAGAYAEQMFAIRPEDEVHHALLGEGGDKGQAGGVVFYDALWVPEGRPFAVDVIAVHHPDYYQKGQAPTDFDSPDPLLHLDVIGKFFFAVEGPAAAAKLAMRILAAALADWGIGSRTRKGYGRFDAKVDGQNDAPRRTELALPWASLESTASGVAQRTVKIVESGPQFIQTVLSFKANLGKFEVEIEGLRSLADESKFDARADFDWAKQRAKKGKRIEADVTYSVSGRNLTIITIAVKKPVV